MRLLETDASGLDAELLDIYLTEAGEVLDAVAAEQRTAQAAAGRSRGAAHGAPRLPHAQGQRTHGRADRAWRARVRGRESTQPPPRGRLAGHAGGASSWSRSRTHRFVTGSTRCAVAAASRRTTRALRAALAKVYAELPGGPEPPGPGAGSAPPGPSAPTPSLPSASREPSTRSRIVGSGACSAAGDRARRRHR